MWAYPRRSMILSHTVCTAILAYLETVVFFHNTLAGKWCYLSWALLGGPNGCLSVDEFKTQFSDVDAILFFYCIKV